MIFVLAMSALAGLLLMVVLTIVTDPEWWGVKRHEGELYFFGFHVWGTILPYIGVKWHPCLPTGEPVGVIDDNPPGWERQAFVIEWFGQGVMLWASTSELRRRPW